MYVDRLREQHATLDQVWVLAGPGETSGDAVWELLGFGDERVLEAIRADERVHRDDVDLKIVVDGDHFRPAWGEEHEGTLSGLAWRLDGPRSATYSKAAVAGAADRRTAVRVR